MATNDDIALTPEQEAEYQRYLDDLAYQEASAKLMGASQAEAKAPARGLSGELFTAGAPAPPAIPEGSGLDPRGLRIGGAAVSRLATGPGQAVTALAELLSGRKGMTKEYTEAVNAIEQKIVGGEPLTPEESEALNMLGMMANVAVPAAGARAVAGTTTKLIPGVAQQMGAGAAGGAMAFDPSVQTAGEGLKGAAYGGAAGLAFGLPPALFNAGRNWLYKGFREAPTPEQAKNIAAIEQAPLVQDLGMTNAQRVGRYEAEVAEARVAGHKAQNFYNDQLNIFYERMKAAVRPGKSASQMGVDAQDAINKTKRSIQSVASNRYETGIEESIRLARSDPANNFGMRVPNVMKALGELPPADKLSALLDSSTRKYLDELNMIIEKVNVNQGVLGMEDMIKLHRAANRIRGGLSKLQDGAEVSGETFDAIRLGNNLADAVESDVDQMSAMLAQRRASGQIPPGMADTGRGYEAAWQRFEQTRADYRQHIGAMRELKATAIVQAFGKTPREPEKQWESLLRMDEYEQKRALNILRAGSPDTIIELKRWKLRTAVNGMMNLTEQGAKAPVSVEKFLDQMTEGGRLVGSEFWTPRELTNIRGAVAYARTILNKAPVRAQQADLEGPIMALASWSSAFLARALYRVMGQGKVENLFFTKEGIEALKTLATTSDPKKASYQAAVSYLMAQGSADAANPPAESAESP